MPLEDLTNRKRKHSKIDKSKVEIESDLKRVIANKASVFFEKLQNDEIPYKTMTVPELVASALGIGRSTAYGYLQPTKDSCPSSLESMSACISSSQETLSEISETQLAQSLNKKFKKLHHRDLVKLMSIVHAFYAKNYPPTVADIKDKFVQETSNSVSTTTLQRALHFLGFRWKKVPNNKRILTENPKIVLWRQRYLDKIKEYRDKGYNIYYLDETWYNSGDNECRGWVLDGDQNTMRVNKIANRGQRIIILHCGSKNGFVQDAEFVMTTKDAGSLDYHKDMDSHNFEKWFSEVLCPKLIHPAAVVMDNAPYHSRKLVTKPKKSWTKGKIAAALADIDIYFTKEQFQSMRKREMLLLGENVKDILAVEEIASEFGVEILRLPPYHCHFNPIEMAWNQVKNFVKRNNAQQDLNNCVQLIRDAFKKVTIENWSSYILHVSKLEEEAQRADHNFENNFDQEEALSESRF